jgi:hypothetical protein
LALAFVSVIIIGNTPEPMPAPNWAAMFSPNGKVIDRQGGLDAFFMEDKISAGAGLDMSICPDPSNPSVVENGVVAAANDLGNGYVWATTNPAGHLILHAGVERLSSTLDTSVEFEFNQERVRVRSGRPWLIHGDRTADDLLVRVDFAGGAIISADFKRWDGTGFQTIVATGPDGCTGSDYRFCAGAPPMQSVQDEVWDAQNNLLQVPQPDSFVEIGINVPVLIGRSLEFTSIQVRTPQDIILDSFRRIGRWADPVQGGSQS